jgi:hypothetical protein
MKTLKRLFIVVFLLAAVGAFWLRSSPLWTILEVHQSIQNRDVPRLERVIAVERFAASSASAIGASVKSELGVSGKEAGSALLGGLVDLVAKGVGDAVAKDAAIGLRRAVKDGTVQRKIGPLEVNEGIEALGGFRLTIDGAHVDVRGVCNGAPAGITLELERHAGILGGYPRSYVIVGIEPTSAAMLMRDCAAAARGSQSTSK